MLEISKKLAENLYFHYLITSFIVNETNYSAPLKIEYVKFKNFLDKLEGYSLLKENMDEITEKDIQHALLLQDKYNLLKLKITEDESEKYVIDIVSEDLISVGKGKEDYDKTLGKHLNNIQ